MISTIKHSLSAALRASASAEYEQARADLLAEDMAPAAAAVYAEKLAAAFLRGASVVGQIASAESARIAEEATAAGRCTFAAELPDAEALAQAVRRPAAKGTRARLAALFSGVTS